MGPPSEDDGKLLTRGWYLVRSGRFNGAAVRGRRKGPHISATTSCPPWASMGPPSEGRRKAPRSRTRRTCNPELLQWGRRPRTTERRGLGKYNQRLAGELQWGRRPRTTERFTGGRYLYPDISELQWGRRPRTTEIRPRSHRLMCVSPCFNGAAVRGRRKAHDDLHGMFVPSCFNGAAVRGRRKVLARRVLPLTRKNIAASMGPPSEDDGKLNGSAAPQVAHQASMGPPSEDDGKRLASRSKLSENECFNGAAVRGRRKAPIANGHPPGK